MTPEMVRVAWGEPTEVVPQAQYGDEIWVYQKGGGSPGMGYPGSSISSGGSSTGIAIGTGPGGTVIAPSVGIGSMGGTMGGSGIGMGGGPVMNRPTRVEIREVIFRDGVVSRADPP